jgi:hypothetical protein
MMAILTRSDRAPPKEDADGSALFKTMLAYTGNFRARAITSSSLMSISLWHPAWNDAEQTRFFKVEGDTLPITTAQQTHTMFPGGMGRGVIAWTRA